MKRPRAAKLKAAAGNAKRQAPAAETAPSRKALPAHCSKVGLVLQGGGALGAYQAGAYTVLAEGGYEPDWVAGVSIGAVNGAIIAGNRPEQRAQRLRGFWEEITNGAQTRPAMEGDWMRGIFNEWSALASLTTGVPGFFHPRIPAAWLQPWGTRAALSFYDTEPLRATLLKFVDFDLLNSGHPRLSVGAANIRKGNSTYFDTAERKIGPEHIMASAALPPGFPPVEIEGEHYWDGGVVSNTPLQYLIDTERESSMVVFQADLFSAQGPMPLNMLDVYERHKDILYSSRTRLNTDVARNAQQLQRAVERLVAKLPRRLADDPDVDVITKLSRHSVTLSIVHLIYREKNYETRTKDYEFSRVSMDEHWHAGLNDTRRTLRHENLWLTPPGDMVPVRTFDVTRDFD